MNQINNFNPHNINWTNSKVGAFWDFMSSKKESIYFAQEVGREVLNLTSYFISLKGEVLDYGSGSGHLIEFILERYPDAHITGSDFSQASVLSVNSKLSSNNLFRGCELITSLPTRFNDESFDVIFCLETIEHLIEDQFLKTLKELYRLLKNKGYVVITTPNNENLGNQQIICPDCGCIFHRVQHVNAFNKEGLINTMKANGFLKVFAEGVNLYDYRKRSFFKRMAKKLVLFFFKSGKKVSPNLVYIGIKDGENTAI